MIDRREQRLGAVRAALQTLGIDAILIQHLPNVRYLTGFTGSAALLLVDQDSAILFSDFRYATQAVQEVGSAARVEIDPVSVWERLKRILGEAEPATLGYEAHVATVRDLERFAGVRSRMIPTTELVERLRATKTPEEIAAIHAAALLADEALDEVLPRIRVGQSEYEVGAELEASLRRRGSEWHPFPTIVASGARSALPPCPDQPPGTGRRGLAAPRFWCPGRRLLRRSHPHVCDRRPGRRAATRGL